MDGGMEILDFGFDFPVLLLHSSHSDATGELFCTIDSENG